MFKVDHCGNNIKKNGEKTRDNEMSITIVIGKALMTI